jgi:LuxR family maltose regulon positive regulatory protein
MLGLLALANHALGDQAAARAALERALALAEPEGFVRVFLDEGAPMADLLRQVTGAHRDFARRLLAAFGGAPGAPAHNTPDAAGPLVEPLTQRELDILRLIAQGLSNAEIGARLFLAPGTVKSYTYSLYGKLDVHSRTQAVSRAQALGLLPAG